MSAEDQKLRELDAQARLAARCEFDVPLVVEAGAGTGKTSTLVGRIVTFALTLGWERADGSRGPERRARHVLERVHAITFTELAAAEMAERVADDLALLSADENPVWWPADEFSPDAERASRAQALLAEIDALAVGTIHAYCSELLRRHGSWIGLHPNPQVDARGDLVRKIVREVVESSLHEAYGHELSPDHLLLAKEDHGPASIEQAVIQWIEAGAPQEGLDQPVFEPSAQTRFTRRFLRLACELAACFPRDRKTLKRAALAVEFLGITDLLEEQASELASAGLEGLLEGALPQTLPANWLENFKKNLTKWAKGDFPQTITKEIGERTSEVERLAQELLPLVQFLARANPGGFEAARRVLAPLLRAVRARMTQAGVLTFDDLLRQAARLVSTVPLARARIRASMDLLLVDEFQDTDHRQCALVEAIAFGSNKDSETAPNPSLFVVGDPKQSIYAWRSADLAAYDRFVETVRAHGGRKLDLAVNFRSSQVILDEVERVLAPGFVEEAELQPRFVRLLARENRAKDQPAPPAELPALEVVDLATEEELENSGGKRPKSAEATWRDAHWFAASVAAACANGMRASSAGLLLRSGTDVGIYTEALREHGVPFDLGRDRGYYQRREIVEATALLRCVLDPSDQLATVACLRSSFAGVPDAAWLPLREAGLFDRMAAWEAQPSGDGQKCDSAQLQEPLLRSIHEVVDRGADRTPEVPGLERLPHWPAGLKSALECIARLRAIAKRAPAEEFVEAMRAETLFEVSEAARYQGAQRSANLERFFYELRTSLDEHEGNLALVLADLRRAVQERREAPEARLRNEDHEAVRVLTIHSSKGLEFDWVHLGQSHKGQVRRGSDKKIRALSGGPAAGTAYELFGWPDFGVLDAEERAARIESCERVRLLYVALTRARARLTVTRTGTAAPDAPAQATSFQQLLALRKNSLEDPRVQIRVEEPPAKPPLTPASAPPSSDLIAQLKRTQAAMEERRTRAHSRSEQARFGAVSREKSRIARLEEFAPSAAEQASPHPESSEGLDPLVAVAVGTALHRYLETFRAKELEEGQDAEERIDVAAYLSDQGDDRLDRAREEFEQSLERLRSNGLLERLAELEPQVYARELPILLPSDEAFLPDSEVAAPLSGYIGSIDLVLRDGDTWTVVDFKSDREESDSGEAHRRQLELYAKALESAFELAEPPGQEIWYLGSGRVVSAG